MTRAQLEHIIRAAATIADDDELIIIGSQSILGQFESPPASLISSMEADLWPRNHPERADLVEGSIGEGSPFHETFGYYAQAVDETTAALPVDWQQRLTRIRNANTRGASGWTIELHDLLIAKYVAGRPKDFDFIRDVHLNGMSRRRILEERLAMTPLRPEIKPLVISRVQADLPRLTK